MMKIKPEVPFLTEEEIEYAAITLLRRYADQDGVHIKPPIPVEKIIDFHLDLLLDWVEIADDSIMAYIDPSERKICLNSSQEEFFNKYDGTLPFTYAHEVGHHELHLTEDNFEQLSFASGPVFLCRAKDKSNRREIQANKFAGYLLMPSDLFMPVINGIDLCDSGIRCELACLLSSRAIRFQGNCA